MKKIEYFCDRCGRMTTEDIITAGEKFNIQIDLCSVCQKEYETTVYKPYFNAREIFLHSRRKPNE